MEKQDFQKMMAEGRWTDGFMAGVIVGIGGLCLAIVVAILLLVATGTG